MYRTLPILVGLLVLAGCETTRPVPAADQLAAQVDLIRVTTTMVVHQALVAVDTEETHEANLERVATIRPFIATTLLPLLKGNELGQITRQTADQALALLDSKLWGREKEAVSVGIRLVLGYVAMPANPAGQLNDADRQRIVALFEGVDRGMALFGQVAVRSGPLRLSWGSR